MERHITLRAVGDWLRSDKSQGTRTIPSSPRLTAWHLISLCLRWKEKVGEENEMTHAREEDAREETRLKKVATDA